METKRKSEEKSPSDQRRANCPDASKWGVEDVVKYFSNLGYKDQAEALQDQVLKYWKQYMCVKHLLKIHTALVSGYWSLFAGNWRTVATFDEKKWRLDGFVH